MKRAASSLAVLVAALALVVGLPAAWAATHLSSTDGFVELTDQVSNDPEVKERLTEVLAERVVAETALPESVAARLSRTVGAAAERALADDGFDTAWTQVVRQAHERFVAEGGPLVVDLAPLAALVTDRVSVLDAPSSLPVAVTGEPPPGVVEAVQQAPTVALVAGLVCAAAAIATLVLAPRRSVAAASLGVAALAAAAIVTLLGRLGGAWWSQTAEGADDGSTRGLLDATADVMAESLQSWVVTTTVVGGALLLVGLASVVVTRRR